MIIFQLGVSAQSLQFQNVTDPLHKKLEKSQTETDLWQFRNQVIVLVVLFNQLCKAQTGPCIIKSDLKKNYNNLYLQFTI